MASGAPDYYGMRWRVETTIRPSMLYPTGKVIAQYLFDEPGKPGQYSAVNGIIDVIAGKFFRSPGSYEMFPEASDGKEAYMIVHPPRQDYDKFGAEIIWSSVSAANKYIDLEIVDDDATTTRTAGLRLDIDNEIAQYYDSTGTYTDITGSDQKLILDGDKWHGLKLVIDFSTGKYVKMYSNELEIDLSDYSIYSTASSGYNDFNVKVRNESGGENHGGIYLDSLIITQEDQT